MRSYAFRLVATVAAIFLLFGLALAFPQWQLFPFVYVPALMAASFASARAMAGIATICLALAIYASAADLLPLIGESRIIRVLLSAAVLATAVYLAWVRQGRDRQLERAARTDYVTGLANRSYFMEQLDTAISRIKTHGPIVVVLLDLDNFKDINDHYGHLTGDEVLAHVGAQLSDLGDHVVTARFGGDEFIALMRLPLAATSVSTRERLVQQFLSSMRLSINRPLPMPPDGLRVSASCGAAIIVSTQTTSFSAIAVADRALYRAKTTQSAIVTETL